jgi:tripartite-type tricarboxylate transporter receptor subunit TctC
MEKLVINLERISLALVLGVGAVFVGRVSTQSAPYPTAPAKVIVAYAPGGAGDTVARILAEKAGFDLGQAVIVDNRSGGEGIIGAQLVARSKPDGYTLLFMATAHVILPSLKQVPYNWERDFQPAFGITATPLVFAVRADSDIKSIADLTGKAKSTPKGIFYASGGTGSISHLAAMRLVKSLQINATHVAYRGLSSAVQALMGDQIQFICVTVADAQELARSGNFRLLAVTTEQRLPNFPDVPTMVQLGFPDFYAASWNAVVAPAKTPSDAIDRLHSAFGNAANDPGVQDRLGKIGVMINVKNGAELESFLHQESTRWRRVIEENNIKLEN